MQRRDETLTYVITEPCINVKDASCVEVLSRGLERQSCHAGDLIVGELARVPLITSVDRTGRYSNHANQIGRPHLLDLLIRCERELTDFAALLQRDGEQRS